MRDTVDPGDGGRGHCCWWWTGLRGLEVRRENPEGLQLLSRQGTASAKAPRQQRAGAEVRAGVGAAGGAGWVR